MSSRKPIPDQWRPVVRSLYVHAVLSTTISQVPGALALGVAVGIGVEVIVWAGVSPGWLSVPPMAAAVFAVLTVLLARIVYAAVRLAPARTAARLVRRLDRALGARGRVEVAFELAKEGVGGHSVRGASVSDEPVDLAQGATLSGGDSTSRIRGAIHDDGYRLAVSGRPGQVFPLSLNAVSWGGAGALITGFVVMTVLGLPDPTFHGGPAQPRYLSFGESGEERDEAFRLGPEDEPLLQSGQQEDSRTGGDPYQPPLDGQEDVTQSVEDLEQRTVPDRGESPENGGESQSAGSSQELALSGGQPEDGNVPIIDQLVPQAPGQGAESGPGPSGGTNGDGQTSLTTEDLKNLLSQLNQQEIDQLFDSLSGAAESEARGADAPETDPQDGQAQVRGRSDQEQSGENEPDQTDSGQPGRGASPSDDPRIAEQNESSDESGQASEATADRVERDPLRMRRSQVSGDEEQDQTVRLAFRTETGAGTAGPVDLIPRTGETAASAQQLERTVALASAYRWPERALIESYAEALLRRTTLERSTRRNEQD